MTKFQLDRPDGPWDYPSFGFRATSGAILDGTTFDPPITSAPDAWWSVYGGGSAQTGITIIFPYGSAGTFEPPVDGGLPIFKRSLGEFQILEADEWVAETDVAAALAASYVPREVTKAAGSGVTVVREIIDPNNTDSAFREVAGSPTFLSTKDPVRFFGWNADKALSAGDAAEPAIWMGFEADYEVSDWNGDGDAHRVMEWYVRKLNPDGADVMSAIGVSFGADDNTSNWATISFDIGDDIGQRSQLQIVPGNGNDALLSLTADQAVWRVPHIFTQPLKFGLSGTDMVLSSDSSTQASLSINGLSTQKFYFFQGIGGGGSALAINTADNLNALTVKAFDAGQPAIVARGTTSQTGDLIEGQNSSSVVKFRVGPAGGIGLFGHAAPSSQPATAVTLADVIAILQGMGACA